MNRIIEETWAMVTKTRRNHALEHATIHILGRKSRDLTLYARSVPRGLVVYGDLPTEEVADAVSEALNRLRNGERQLAVHPNCGTNLVTAGGMSGLAALLALGAQQMGKKKKGWQIVGSLPLVVLASTAALVLAQPVGQLLQSNLTTEADIKDLHVTSITRHNQGPIVFHTIRTTY